MRTITVHIDEDIWREIRQNFIVRSMTAEPAGILDAFAYGLIEKIEAGCEEWTPQRRNSGRRSGEPR